MAKFMSETSEPKTAIILLLAAVILGVFLLLRMPGLLTSDTGFLTVLTFSVGLFCLAEYHSVMLPVLAIVFLWAGSDVPYQQQAYAGRWVVLAMAGVFGLIVWSRSPHKLDFGTVHLFAAFTVLTTLFSALGAAVREVALLKCLSLFLFFLYLAIGGRVTFQGRERLLVHRLLKIFQAAILLYAALYLANLPFWYNPNALGAVMGIFAWPVVLWGYLIATDLKEKRYATFVVVVCGVLVLLSRARAGMLAAAVSSLVLLFCLRQMRIAGLALLALVVFFTSFMLVDQESFRDYTQTVIYKPGESDREFSVLSSRRTPWQKAVQTIQEHPWFGTGLGTPDKEVEGSIFTTGGYREHGNSYLTIAEGLGLAGMMPFALLLLVLLHRVWMACQWMRRTGNPAHCAIPLVAVMVGGLTHAIFEDWLLSPGSYLCIGFWIITFWALDLTRSKAFLPDSVPALAAKTRMPPQAHPVWSR